DIPVILGAGADTSQNGNVLITWNQNGQEDTYGYVIYTFDSNGFLFELDTVWGWQNTSYTYPDNLANGPLSYSVAAFDSCFTSSFPVTYQTSAKAYINKTMVLDGEIKMCEKTTTFSWTPYVGRTVSVYRIWKKHNGSWENVLSTDDTSATVSVENGESYCFYVEALFNDGIGAFSSPSCFVVPSPGQPTFHYFELATIHVDDVVLTDYIDASVGIQAIQFERRRALDGAFEIIATVPVSSNFTSFIDETANVNEYSLEYRTKFIDSCGGLSTNYTNINRTIFVSGNADEYDLINSIAWNRYEGFNAGVSHYLIYRSLNGGFTEGPIAQITNLDNNQEIYSYTDEIDSLVSNVESAGISDYSNGAMCYRIVAVEKTGNIFGFQDSSQSNDLCLNYKPFVFIPNAFTPGGLNPIFIPVITNVSETNYSFEILNRWGDIFFSTHDILQGWDGKIASNGKDAANDIYRYRIEFEDQNGNFHTKNGMVSLLR
ncbi:MAG: gliding motility-associated C-terminal domain-containing protein, partial [Crocinitomicaceae bacterium]